MCLCVTSNSSVKWQLNVYEARQHRGWICSSIETMAKFSWMAAQSCSLSTAPQHILFSAITRKQSEWAFNWPFNCSVNPCGEAGHQSVIFPSTMVHLRHQLYLRILCMEQMERHIGIEPIFQYPSFQKTNNNGV